MNNTAVDFLMYNYLGITHGQYDWHMVAISAVNRAYKDATNQGAYNTRVKESKRLSSARQKEQAEECMINMLDELITGKYSDYDSWHKKICDELVEMYKKEDLPFGYGNAQKWVNMTMKYIYIVYSLRLLEDQGADALNKYIKDFHAPIDSYILEGLKYTDLYDQIESSTWSKWQDYCKYMNLQYILRKRYGSDKETVLDWENSLWTAVSQYRKANPEDKSMMKARIEECLPVSIDIKKVRLSPDHTPKQYSDGTLDELVDSIREHGLLIPVEVYEKGENYVLLSGERRYRAAQMACIKTIKAMIRAKK